MKERIVAPLVGHPRAAGGGSQAFVSDLARGLVGRAHESMSTATGSWVPGVTVIDTGVDPCPCWATLYRRRWPRRPEDRTRPRAPSPAVYSRVRQTRYDVVHNHAFDAPAIALAGSVNVPVVHTLHCRQSWPSRRAPRRG